jgi:chromosome partitioning protein
LIDSCPGLGILLNSTLNASSALIIPVDTGFYGYMGVQELFKEIEEIRIGTNAGLHILGFVLTMCDRTLITKETLDALKNRFGDQVFRTTIRRCVSLRESPAVGKSIFDYAPKSNGAEDYKALADEAILRLATPNVIPIQIVPTQEVAHV